LGLIASDITTLKDAEYNLKVQKAYMEDLFENSPEAMK